MVMPAVRAVGAVQIAPNQPVARAASTVVGDLMVALLLVDNSTVAPTAPTGWTAEYAWTGAQPRFHLYWKIATSSEPADYTWTFPTVDDNSIAAGILTIEAGTFNAAAPIALTTVNPNTGDVSASVHTHPGLTTTLADALAFWMFGHRSSSAQATQVGTYDTFTTGLTERINTRSDGWVGLALATEPRATAGATGTRSATWRVGGTATARTTWRTLGFVVQGSAGGLTPTRTLTDSAAITDSASRVLAANRTLTDSAAATDSASWSLSSGAQQYTRTLTDAAALTDSASWSMQYGPQTVTRTLTDSAALTDSASWTKLEPNPTRTLVDSAAITDSATWHLSSPVLGDYQFVLLDDRTPRMIFGLGAPVVVHPDGFDPAYGDLRTQDQNAPQGDWRRFGADKRTPGVWSWEAWTDGRTPAQALELVDAMAEAWDAEETRETPGRVLPLQYKIPGRPIRRVYGRPRNFQSDSGPFIQGGRLNLSFELHRVEDVTYDDDEQSVPVYLGKAGDVTPSPWRFPLRFPTSTRTNTVPRVEQVTIGGRLRTWVTLGIRGPVVNPWVQIGTRRWALVGQVPTGRTVWLSGLPWAQTVYMDDGTFRPDMLDARARLGHLRFEPGTYPATFGGYDPTGTASAEVRWRNAYRGW